MSCDDLDRILKDAVAGRDVGGVAPRVVEAIRDGLAIHDLDTALRILGAASYTQAKSLIIGFLTSPEPELRCTALEVLVLDWGMAELASECERLLLDEYDFVRCMASSCLGALFSDSRDTRVSRRLAGIVSQAEEEPGVREAAYRGLLSVFGVPKDQRPPGHRSLRIPEDIDWKIMRTAMQTQ